MQELVQCELSGALDSGASRVFVSIIGIAYAALLAVMLTSLVRAVRASPGAAAGPSLRSSAAGVLALLALQSGLIREDLFAALIAVAIATSMASGPVLARVVAPPSPDRNNGDGC